MTRFTIAVYERDTDANAPTIRLNQRAVGIGITPLG